MRNNSIRITRRSMVGGSIATAAGIASITRASAQDATPMAPVATPEATGIVEEVLLTGLADPRFLAVDGDSILFTESGTGGEEPLILIAVEGTPESTEPVSMHGKTGKLSRLAADGTVTEIVSDFRSYTFGANGEIVGAAGLAIDGQGSAYVAVGAPGPFISQIPLTGEEGVVYKVDLATGAKEVVANILQYELANDPDPMTLDSNLYGLDIMDGTVYVADSGANTVFSVDTSASNEIAAFAITGGFEAPFLPPDGNPLRGGAREIDSVPSCAVTGPDGRLYVSYVTGGPFPTGFSRVDAYSADGTFETVAEGLTMVSDVAFSADGTLYVCEISTDFVKQAPGRVVRVNADGSLTPVIDGLVMPNGMVFDASDNLYLTTFSSVVPGGGNLVRYSNVTTSAGVTAPAPDESAASPEASPAADTTGSGEPVNIGFHDTYFEPNAFEISANVDVQVIFTNHGFLLHDFVIDDPEVKSPVLAEGESANVVINLPAGEYTFYCAQVGHRALGMEGTLTVA